MRAHSILGLVAIRVANHDARAPAEVDAGRRGLQCHGSRQAQSIVDRSGFPVTWPHPHPERFVTQVDPKILDLPEDAWINKPEQEADESAA
nr:hypothetical protein [Leekyejoonella antrihumi]